MREFLQGFIKGAKETPLGYFAPAIAVWRILVTTTNSLTGRDSDTRPTGD